MSRTRVRLPELDARERELLDQIIDLESIVSDTDWFLKSCIDKIRKDALDRYTYRVQEQHERYARWKWSQS